MYSLIGTVAQVSNVAQWPLLFKNLIKDLATIVYRTVTICGASHTHVPNYTRVYLVHKVHEISCCLRARNILNIDINLPYLLQQI